MIAQKEIHSIQRIAKVAGALYLLVAAFGYLLDSFSHILVSGYKTGPVYLALPIAIAEIAFPLWLLIKGVNTAKWEEHAFGSTLSPIRAPMEASS